MVGQQKKTLYSLLGVFSLFFLLLVVFIQSGNPQTGSSQAQIPAATAGPVVATIVPGSGAAPTATPLPGSGAIPTVPVPLAICKDPSKICDFDDDGVCMSDDPDERLNIINMLYTACAINPQPGFGPLCSACDQKANRDGSFTSEDVSFCKEYCASVTPIPTKTNPTVAPTTIKPTVGGGAPKCATQNKGDCDCNGKTDIVDVECFRQQYVGEAPCSSADCTLDNKCSLIDFECLRPNITF